MSTSTDPTPTDPTPPESAWRPLRLLLDAMDADIQRIYTEAGVELRPRFVGPLLLLAGHGPMTIRALADTGIRTHSAMSQTVAALRRSGFVETGPGADARTQLVSLTEAGEQVIPLLEAEWESTELVVAELEAEIPYALSAVVDDLRAALARNSFHDRIQSRLRQRGFLTEQPHPDR